MHGVGFEPTHPKIWELESHALDRSAIRAAYRYQNYYDFLLYNLYITRYDGAKKHLFDFHTELVTRVSTKNESWSSYVTRNATVLWTYPGFVVVLGLK